MWTKTEGLNYTIAVWVDKNPYYSGVVIERDKKPRVGDSGLAEWDDVSAVVGEGKDMRGHGVRQYPIPSVVA